MKKKKRKTNILLVEDDYNLGYLVKDNLEGAGFQVTLCQDGLIGLEAFLNNFFDICLIDIMLPKKDGFSLAKDIRQQDEAVPIIFLTAKSLTKDKVEGFKLGGDDYITKPFDLDELLMRINAILKHTLTKTSENNQDLTAYKLGEYIFDMPNKELKINGETISLTRKEAAVLKLLVLHKNKVLTRETLLESVWKNNDYFSGRSMDVFVSKLRKYLSKSEEVQIMNVHGIGFKLITN